MDCTLRTCWAVAIRAILLPFHGDCWGGDHVTSLARDGHKLGSLWKRFPSLTKRASHGRRRHYTSFSRVRRWNWFCWQPSCNHEARTWENAKKGETDGGKACVLQDVTGSPPNWEQDLFLEIIKSLSKPPWVTFVYRCILHNTCRLHNTCIMSVSQFSSVAQSCPTLCDPMNCSTPGLPVHHQLLHTTETSSRFWKGQGWKLYLGLLPN